MNLSTTTTRPTVLTSWKDIAQYMGKGVRTVQRWEQDFALPVRRPSGANKKAILARPGDLDAWVALRCGRRPPSAAFTAVFAVMPQMSGDISRARASLEALSALNAQIQTSTMLRARHVELMDQVSSALVRLRRELQEFGGHRANSCAAVVI
jgi:hypothetical protein